MADLLHVREDFYPRPPRGGRRFFAQIVKPLKLISIHALREEGDVIRLPTSIMRDIFLSTPSARRATGIIIGCPEGQKISIHALREEGDFVIHGADVAQLISIHALREEGDLLLFFRAEQTSVDFYPRPPRGGRQQKQRQNLYFQTNYTTFCTNLEEP